MSANAGAKHGNLRQRHERARWGSGHGITQAIRNSLLLPQLAVHRLGMERVMGIEPTLAAWEAAVLPLNYTRAGAVILRNRGAFWQSPSGKGRSVPCEQAAASGVRAG